MKTTAILLALTLGLSAHTVSARSVREDAAPGEGTQPQLRGGRAAETFTSTRPSREMRRDAQNLRGSRELRRGAPAAGPRGYARGGDRNFHPAKEPKRRGFDAPQMDQRPRGHEQFTPPMGRAQGPREFGLGPGPMRRGFGGPPMMNDRGPQARRDLAPPPRGQRPAEMAPMRRGQGRPPMMNQGPAWGREQFVPQARRGQGRPEFGPGAGPARRGFGGPPQMNDRGPRWRQQFTPPVGGQRRPEMGPMRRGQLDAERPDRPEGRGPKGDGNRRPAPRDRAEQDRN